MELKPSEIFYSQNSIMNKFGGYTSHRDTYIGETLDQLLCGHCNVNSIPTISVGQMNGKWFTSDNRRLWVFRKAEELGFLKTITVYVSCYLNEEKFTTVNNGTSIRVRGSGPGGSLWRTRKPRRTPTNYNLNKKRVTSANRSTASLSLVNSETRTTLRQYTNTAYVSSLPVIPRAKRRTPISPDYRRPVSQRSYGTPYVSDYSSSHAKVDDVHIRSFPSRDYRRPVSQRSYGMPYASDYSSSHAKVDDVHIRSFPSSEEWSVSRQTLSSSLSQPYGNIHTRERSPPNYRKPEESYHSRNRDSIHGYYSLRDPPSAVTRQQISSTRKTIRNVSDRTVEQSDKSKSHASTGLGFYRPTSPTVDNVANIFEHPLSPTFRTSRNKTCLQRRQHFEHIETRHVANVANIFRKTSVANVANIPNISKQHMSPTFSSHPLSPTLPTSTYLEHHPVANVANIFTLSNRFMQKI